MSELTPQQYHSLAPFADFFRQGIPVLMYHKIGPRPTGAKMKGLYVAPDRFQIQLQELQEAGFRTMSLSRVRTSKPQEKTIVLTFDDGFASSFVAGMAEMSKHKFTAIQFLVSSLIGRQNEWDLLQGEVQEPLMDDAQVREWLAAGHEIGSHTRTHPRLGRLTVRDAKEEIEASKKALEDRFGVPVRHFAYPYGDCNASVRDLVQEAGYESACTTDFGLNGPATPLFSLHRIFVRYPTRSLKSWKTKLWS